MQIFALHTYLLNKKIRWLRYLLVHIHMYECIIWYIPHILKPTTRTGTGTWTNSLKVV